MDESGETYQIKQPEKPYFIRLVLATDLVSTDRQATYVLLALSALLLLLAFLIPLFTGGSGGPKVPPQQIQQLMNASGG